MSSWLPWNWGDNRNYNEGGIHEIPQDIGEEIEEDYYREDTEEEKEAMDDFDDALSNREIDTSNDVEPLIVRIFRSLFG